MFIRQIMELAHISASGSLYHLSDGAVIFMKKSLGKVNGAIINNLRFLVDYQVSITSVFWDKAIISVNILFGLL